MSPKVNATEVFIKNWEAAVKLKDSGEREFRYIINSGSSRSSKTHSIIQLFYLYAIKNPNKKLSVFRDTKQICKQTVLEDMKKIFIGLPNYSTVKFNITESIFKFSNGSTIHIEGTDDSIKIHGYHCDVLWINEGYNISKDTFDQLDMRCSDFVILDLNPRQSHWSEDVAKYTNSITIHSTFLDNPFCPDEQRRKILSYQPVSMCRVVTEKILTTDEAIAYDIDKNELGITPGRIKELVRCRENEYKNTANEFNWSVYGLGLKAEKPNRILRFTEISDSDYHKIQSTVYSGCDWGSVDPWGILEAKYYDGCLYLHELNYASENEIRSKLTTTELYQIAGADEGIVKWKFGKLGIPNNRVIVCDNNRPLKIIALREAGWDYAIAASKPQGSIIDGIDLLNNLKVFYTSSSTNLKYEQENYSRKIDRNGVILEEPEDIDNHLIDPARYIALFLQSQGVIKNI